MNKYAVKPIWSDTGYGISEDQKKRTVEEFKEFFNKMCYTNAILLMDDAKVGICHFRRKRITLYQTINDKVFVYMYPTDTFFQAISAGKNLPELIALGKVSKSQYAAC